MAGLKDTWDTAKKGGGGGGSAPAIIAADPYTGGPKMGNPGL